MQASPTDMGGYTLTEDASLKARNTLRVPARAALLAEIHDAAALETLFAFPAVREQEALVLGEGSNVLFTRDFDGVVVAMATRGIEVLEDRGEDACHLRVAAGERWDDVVRWTLGRGMPGLENLIMIPGLTGAAPIQNIGAYGVEVAEFITHVEAFDRQAGRIERLDRAACTFAYRDSTFKREPDRWAVTAVEFALPRDRTVRTDYAGLRDELARMDIGAPAPFHVAEAVVRLRTRKLPDPALIGNVGSFFKNPLVDAATAAALRADHPDLPQWPVLDGRVKLSAAWIIETCEFKGLREGDAGVSNRHALVLVNHGEATGAQIMALAERIRGEVQRRFGIELEPEPRIL